MELESILPWVVFAAIVIGVWAVFNFFSSSESRASERLDELRDPRLRNKGEAPGTSQASGVGAILGKAAPALESVCSNLAHGVSLCPYRAAEVWLPQQDTPLFLNSSRTQVLTIPQNGIGAK
jgi:hypothetical protein